MLGVDWSKTLISQPDNAEVALNLVEHLCGHMKSGDMIVVDSVAALTPEAEMSGEMGDSHMGLQARLMSQALRKLTHIVSTSGIILIFINQIRCLPLDSLILRNGALSRLKDLRMGDVVPYCCESSTTVQGLHIAGVVPGKKLQPKNCPPFSLSNLHWQPVVDCRGQVINKQGSDIAVGDWLIQPLLKKSQQLSDAAGYIDLSDVIQSVGEALPSNAAKVQLPRILDEDLAFFLGCCY